LAGWGLGDAGAVAVSFRGVNKSLALVFEKDSCLTNVSRGKGGGVSDESLAETFKAGLESQGVSDSNKGDCEVL